MTERSKRRGWVDPPPVVILSGTYEDMIQRELQKAARAASRSSRHVLYISDLNDVKVQLGLSGFFADSKKLLVVENPSKLDADLVTDHWNQDDNTITLVLVFTTKGKKTKLQETLEELGVKAVIYDEPPIFKRSAYMEQLAITEARSYGVSLSTDCAQALIAVVGSDLFTVCSEVQKAAIYTIARGGSEVTLAELKETVTKSRDTNLSALKQTVGDADTKGLLKVLEETYRNSTADPTMGICVFLGNLFTQWLWSTVLSEQSIPVPECAGKVGVSPYEFERCVKYGKFWGVGHLTDAIRSIADIEAGVTSGWVNPWVSLESTLVFQSEQVRLGLKQ